VLSLVKGGSISIRVNDEISSYFKADKGLRQGDPLSSLMFNLVVDDFTRILIKVAAKGYITGFMDSLYLRISSTSNMLMIPYCFKNMGTWKHVI
jgi:hypothetical protein